MLTDLSFLKCGQPFPPECTRNRLKRYKENKELFEDNHEQVYKEQFERIERFVENFGEAVSYLAIVNYQKLISVKTADLVFGEFPKITTGEESQQGVIDEILLETEFFNYMTMAALDVSRYGDSIIMQTANGGVDVIAPALWFPVVNPHNIRQIKFHVFGFIYLLDTERKVYGLKVQIHKPDEPGKCEEHLYKLEGQSKDDFIIGAELTKKHEIEVETEVSSCPVYRIVNTPTSDRIFGIDDYRSVDSLISELEVRLSQIGKILDKHADPSMTGPSSALELDEKTQQLKFKVGGYYPRNDETEPKPEYLTWDAHMQANFEQIETIINQLYVISEMGSALLGDLSGKTGQVPSGSALRRLMMSPLGKARRIANGFDPVIKKLLSSLAESKGVTIKPATITVTWNDGLPKDPKEEAEIANIRTSGKATSSQLAAIKRLDGSNEEDAASELEEIRADEALQDIGTLDGLPHEDEDGETEV